MNEDVNEIGWNLADEDIARGVCDPRVWTDEEIVEAADDYGREVRREDMALIRAAYRVAFAEMRRAEVQA